MLAPQTTGPVRQIALGLLISLFFFGALCLCLDGCGATLTGAVVECKLNALKVLPDDVRFVTPYDAVDIWQRVRACDAAATDGGAP